MGNISVSCAFCYKEFDTQKWRESKFCSVQCNASMKERLGSVDITCEVCGGVFRCNKSDGRKYCSRQCGNIVLGAAKKKDRVQLICEQCGGPFSVRPFESKSRHFCSSICANKRVGIDNSNILKNMACLTCGIAISKSRNVGKTRAYCEEHTRFHKEARKRNCLKCGNEFSYTKSAQKYCSKSCAIAIVSEGNRTATRSSKCVDCGMDILVARATSNANTRCKECHRQHKNKLERINHAQNKKINKQAQYPYVYHTLTGMIYDKGQHMWNITIVHNGSQATKVIPLATYAMETKIGRFLRGDEVVTHINGNTEDCRPSNLKLVTKQIKEDPTNFWGKPLKETA